MRRVLYGWLDFFQDFRTFLLSVERWKKRYPQIAKVVLAAMLLGVPVVVLGCYTQEVAVVVGVSLLMVVLCYVALAGAALSSCTRLLAFWFGYTILLPTLLLVAVNCLVVIPNYEVGYVLFSLLYTLLYLLLAGAADHEPAKLGCAIVNTVTTILLIVVNVLAFWAGGQLAPTNLDPAAWSTLQYYTTLILLPAVVAGYLAALLKQVQYYVAKKRQLEKDA